MEVEVDDLKRGAPAGRPRDDATRLVTSMTGLSPEQMARDPRALARGLIAFGSQAARLVRGYVSDDPDEHAAALRRWAELEAMLPALGDGQATRPGLTERDRARLRLGLARVVQTLDQIRDEVGLEETGPERGNPATGPHDPHGS